MKFTFSFLFMLLCFSACETEEDPCGNFVLCEIFCENGYILDENGCELCECIIEGCMDSTSFNFNADANVDDGSCIPFIFGCMDPDAANYNPLANIDDESCLYPLFFENIDNNK